MMKYFGLILSMILTFSAFTQSATLIEAQALRQIHDLKGGTLLIPLDTAQRSLAIGSKSMEWAIAKEHNEQLRSAFHDHFTLCKVLFFYLDDAGNVGEVFDHQMHPVASPFFDGSTFIAHLWEDEFTVFPDYIEFSKKADKRRARKKKKASKKALKNQEWQQKQVDMVDASIAKNRDRWTHEQFERALALRAYYENYFEPTDFEKELLFFSPGKLDDGCMVVERTSPVVFEKSNKKSYSFNFHVYVRDYPDLDAQSRYIRLANSLQQKIELSEQRLLRHQSREAKLR